MLSPITFIFRTLWYQNTLIYSENAKTSLILGTLNIPVSVIGSIDKQVAKIEGT